jgi:hypothetical protein
METLCMVCGRKYDKDGQDDKKLSHGLCDQRCAAVFEEWTNMDRPKPTLRQLYWKRVHGEWNAS